MDLRLHRAGGPGLKGRRFHYSPLSPKLRMKRYRQQSVPYPPPKNGKKAVVISSIRKLEMLSSARCQPIEAVKTYSGYRVSKRRDTLCRQCRRRICAQGKNRRFRSSGYRLFRR